MATIVKEDMRMRLESSERKRIMLKRSLSQRSLEDDSTLWSLADLMTLLLIFFILFYSQAINNVGSGREQSKTTTSVTRAQNGEQPESLSNTTSSKVKTPRVSEPETKDESLEVLRQEVLETVINDNSNDISVHWNQRRLVLVLGEQISFNVGDAELIRDFQPTLRIITGFIAEKEGYRVVVAGHTDDTPINSELYPSNWELSVARAVNVAKFLIKNGVNPLRISIEGYAEYSPIRDNTSYQNRRSNRRVEITLIKNKEGDR